ncbi:MAG: hypothetical protein H6R14_793 [Proteobacteria bacterium]|nr:hypothetical protein [Pseudomonadota bacterium]
MIRPPITLLSALIATISLPIFAEENADLAILIAPEPIEYRMEYSLHTFASIIGAWGPLLANKARNNSLSGDLTTAMMRSGVRPNQELREATEKHLAAVGIKTERTNLPINPTNQAATNYREAAKDRPVLHVYFERIGIQSRPSSKTYTPFAHVYYCLVQKGKSACDETADRGYYGEGYTEHERLVVPAEPVYQWIDADDVMRRQSDVIASIHAMSDAMGKEIAEAVSEHMRQ